MTSFLSQLNYDPDTIYPESDGNPMTESDPTRDYLVYSVEALNLYFQNRPDVYVSGNLFVYYERGVPDAVVSPDVFVIFGVEKKQRRTYKAWEEGNQLPSFVLEVTSKTTRGNDEQDKPQKYVRMGVSEYFQYDPTGDYLNPPLKGSRLVENRYELIPLTTLPDGSLSLYSQSLGLELRVTDGKLRYYEPQTETKLLTHAETDQARQEAEQARQEAEQARQEAEQARQEAEQARQEAEQARYEAISRLAEMGLSVEQIAIALNLSIDQVRQFTQ
ncbi:Uma2 family endonuclease [Leptolyngbya sp. NIES-2104]|uniref:Uma2 family endonuclease n=1 Tax=Leptolyngbya sp. NIES-2104 TaxID=1552121 RepID=UPI00073E6A5D|nr:Uma2 family endonuclease [Leptolyngbya sp. NIES-2104]